MKTQKKLKTRTVGVKPEKKGNVFLQHDNGRPHTSILTRDTIADFGGLPLYSPELTSDLQLFGIVTFLGNNDNAVILAVKRWGLEAEGDFYEREMQDLVH
jgi:hypothetical protein